jgi:hypothetical protein
MIPNHHCIRWLFAERRKQKKRNQMDSSGAIAPSHVSHLPFTLFRQVIFAVMDGVEDGD